MGEICKFRNVEHPVIIMGEISKLILRVQPRTKHYTFDGASFGRLGDLNVGVKEQKWTEAKK